MSSGNSRLRCLADRANNLENEYPSEILQGVYDSLDDFESVVQLACTSRALGAVYQANRWPIIRANLSSHPAMRDGGLYNGFKLHKLLYPSKQSSYIHSQRSRANC
jgi:hypothetical protein